MKQIMLWMLTAILILSGLTTLTSCTIDDNAIVEPVEQVLQDGEWTGTGEGRSGSQGGGKEPSSRAGDRRQPVGIGLCPGDH